MAKTVISVEHLTKRYDLGVINTGTFSRDINRWWARLRGKPDPYRKIGQPDHGNRSGDSILALDDVSFQVQQGETLGIIGRNGAGKSTLLKILSRVTAPTSGKVKMNGHVGSLLEVGTGFHPELTGRENIYLNGAILGMSRKEVDRKFDEIVAFSGVEQFIDTPVKRYSSGMYVRLAFAVAAHLEPEILIVDEVLAVGDAEFQRKCMGKMSDVAHEGRTVLFVSHNMAAIEQLCSQAILLYGGKIEKLGLVDSVIECYLSVEDKRNSVVGNILAGNIDGSVVLLSIGSIDEEGRRFSMAQCGQDFKLTISLRTAIPLDKVIVSIGINSIYGSRVAVLRSDIAGADLSLTPGCHSIVCQIPCFSLSPGNYTMDVKIISNHEVLIWAPGLEQLLVEAGDFFNTGKLPDPSWSGVCLLHQQWKINDGRS